MNRNRNRNRFGSRGVAGIPWPAPPDDADFVGEGSVVGSYDDTETDIELTGPLYDDTETGDLLLVQSTGELMRVLAKSGGNTVAVTRGHGGTTAAPIPNNGKVRGYRPEALDPPAGATAWFRADDVEGDGGDDYPAGGTVNLGSVEGTWKAAATGTSTIETDGPNGLKYLRVLTRRHLRCHDGDDNARNAGDFISVGTGMRGFIFRGERGRTGAGSGFDEGIDRLGTFGGGAGFVLHGASSNGGPPTKVSSIHNDGTLRRITADYTSGSWRAAVIRWNGSNLFMKMDGDESWASVAAGDISALDILRVGTEENNNATNGLAEWLAYAAQSEESGDALLDYLVARAGL